MTVSRNELRRRLKTKRRIEICGFSKEQRGATIAIAALYLKDRILEDIRAYDPGNRLAIGMRFGVKHRGGPDPDYVWAHAILPPSP